MQSVITTPSFSGSFVSFWELQRYHHRRKISVSIDCRTTFVFFTDFLNPCFLLSSWSSHPFFNNFSTLFQLVLSKLEKGLFSKPNIVWLRMLHWICGQNINPHSYCVLNRTNIWLCLFFHFKLTANTRTFFRAKIELKVVL